MNSVVDVCVCSLNLTCVLHETDENKKTVLSNFINCGFPVRNHKRAKLLKKLRRIIESDDIKLLKTLIHFNIKEFLTNDDFDYVLSKVDYDNFLFAPCVRMKNFRYNEPIVTAYDCLKSLIDKSYLKYKHDLFKNYLIQRENERNLYLYRRLTQKYYTWNITYYYSPECDFGLDMDDDHRHCKLHSHAKYYKSDDDTNSTDLIELYDSGSINRIESIFFSKKTGYNSCVDFDHDGHVEHNLIIDFEQINDYNPHDEMERVIEYEYQLHLFEQENKDDDDDTCTENYQAYLHQNDDNNLNNVCIDVNGNVYHYSDDEDNDDGSESDGDGNDDESESDGDGNDDDNNGDNDDESESDGDDNNDDDDGNESDGDGNDDGNESNRDGNDNISHCDCDECRNNYNGNESDEDDNSNNCNDVQVFNYFNPEDIISHNNYVVQDTY
jgi:hypothetical protein